MLNNWCFWTVVLEKTLESPLDCMESHPINPKGNESWRFIRRTDAEAETPILWPPDVKNWLIRKDRDAEKDWRQEKTGMPEDEMIGWHHWLDGHEFEQTLRVGDGLGSLACYSPWGGKESDTTERLTWTFPVLNQSIVLCLVLTIPSWHASGFSGDKWGDLVFPSLEEFSSLLIHTVKSFSVVNEAK